jgi:hypothetical protein
VGDPRLGVAFTASGSLTTLETNAIATADAIEKQLGEKPTAATAKPHPGTFSLHLSTGGAGAYMAGITIDLDITGEGTFTLDMSFAHAPEPVGARAGAKLIPPSILAGL